ncbi:putative amidophosphoribosyltransferase [Brevibacterium sanguinis]|uniref:Amidophosphoribosyltransferase n=2 Tax=Brevibacterium TaxID=1696 RepID=A0ABX9GSB1_9MICO|nr:MULTISPECIES: ComF family protein [Brevibacterium]RBP66146.1 putative amidophosphoribosyltransferase [Brevibacterium sanguinis]RBP72797.1 putative amidophosphoribosyltransferase [Brevibacterium celere]
MGLLAELGELLLPRRCAGCGRENVSLCTACLHLLAGIPRAMEPRYGGIPVVGIAEYTAHLSRMVVGFKDDGRRDILDPLALGLARSITAALEMAPCSPGPVLVIPAPSSERARRRRGGSHTAALARRTAALAPELRLLVVDVLRARRRRDQVGLGARARQENASGTQLLAPGARELLTRPEVLGAGAVILVDDFATTGATLAESARILASVQIRPAVAAVLGLGRGGTRFVSPFTV